MEAETTLMHEQLDAAFVRLRKPIGVPYSSRVDFVQMFKFFQLFSEFDFSKNSFFHLQVPTTGM